MTALLTDLPVLIARAVTVILTVAFSAIVPSAHLTLLPLVLHVPVAALAPVSFSRAGSLSVTTTCSAMPGPLFLASSV